MISLLGLLFGLLPVQSRDIRFSEAVKARSRKILRMIAPHGTVRRQLPVWAIPLFLVACGGPTPVDPDPDPDPDPDSLPEPVAIPAQGTASTLDVVTWNLLYFGSPNAGPSDEKLQMARIRDVIKGTDADLWSVQEVTSNNTFDELLSHLPGYAGLLANDSIVTHGSDYYTGGEQKVGIIYKSAIVSVTSAQLVLTELNSAFAGRPPLEVRIRLTMGGATRDAVVLSLHAKASDDTASYNKRAAAAVGLKAYVDSALANDLVLIPGDWNDDVDESITEGRDTPYRMFVNDTSAWVFPTGELSAEGATSHLRFNEVIDHILGSNEAMQYYEAESALAYRVDEYIVDFLETVSDHIPVLVRFTPPGGT
ncbi:MAG: endonuclease [Gemmatimonadetes bacterium]|nr:endonuclease [Gemmatimonadota bacterium]MYB97191.1 endonuclease [Gemmatimonadota bacterium]MYI45228.1 endonuclease [Gemmatimonadota bacterium]